MIAHDQEEVDLVGECHTSVFDELIAPINRESFLASFWCKSFLRLTGQKGRFKQFLSWGDLNSILEQHSLAPPRLRLFRDGKPIDSSLFVFVRSKRRAQLNAAGLMNCLAEGATLILDHVDELAPSVGRLAEDVQGVLRSPTNVN